MSKRKPFRHLLSTGRIGSLEIRNRIIMAPMGTNLGEPDGHVGERIQQFYEERAKGGVGLIIIGVASVSYPAGACIVNQVAISDDKYLPGLERLTRRIHAHGTKVAVQIQHAGKVARQDIPGGRPMLVPSAFAYDVGDLLNDLTDDELYSVTADSYKEGAKLEFHSMTLDDIQKAIEQFADAADRAKRAGFDGIEIHGGHGYLISSFISPKTNKRTDAYGGSVEKRARLLVEVIRAVRERVGEGFPVWCRLDGKEIHIEGGISLEDAQETAVLAEAAGVDAIHVSAYGNPSMGAAFTEAPLVQQPCGFMEFAERFKKKVGIPIIAVGRIEPHQGDEIIRKGKADFIAMARKLIADPELPSKLNNGHAEDLRPCICCYTCVGEIFLNKPAVCSVNTTAGKEFETVRKEAPEQKRVLVVGGGLAGMEAARIAALRGHTVTLCEKEKHLGGTVFFASMLYPDNGRLIDWLRTQVLKSSMDVRMGQEVTPEFVREVDPQVVIVAVGARRDPPEIQGADRSHVLSGDDLRSLMTGSKGGVAGEKLSFFQRLLLNLGKGTGLLRNQRLVRSMTRFWMPLGKRVAIVGGGLVGVEVAAFLAERKRQVFLIEEGRKLAVEMGIPRRWRVLHELREMGVNLYMETKVESIGAKEMALVSTGGERKTLETDAVILATGVQENLSLYEALQSLGYDVHLAGDCSGVGYIEGAMRDAARIAWEI